MVTVQGMRNSGYRHLTHLTPLAAVLRCPSFSAPPQALFDWDADGYVCLSDLLDADELATRVEEERGMGAASRWARVLQVGWVVGARQEFHDRGETS